MSLLKSLKAHADENCLFGFCNTFLWDFLMFEDTFKENCMSEYFFNQIPCESGADAKATSFLRRSILMHPFVDD